MTQIRLGTPGDAARERELWQLAFGDDGAYVDNFYQTYYKPERMLLLEEDGVVQSMTAWFDTQLVLPGEGRFRAAYLYAVATDPANMPGYMVFDRIVDADCAEGVVVKRVHAVVARVAVVVGVGVPSLPD